MVKFKYYVESVMQRAAIKNQKELAARAGITPSAVNIMMRADFVPSDELCIKLASLVGDDPAKVILIAHAAKASESARPVWEKILRTVAAAALVLVISFSVYYVKCFFRAVRVRLSCLFLPLAVAR